MSDTNYQDSYSVVVAAQKRAVTDALLAVSTCADTVTAAFNSLEENGPLSAAKNTINAVLANVIGQKTALEYQVGLYNAADAPPPTN